VSDKQNRGPEKPEPRFLRGVFYRAAFLIVLFFSRRPLLAARAAVYGAPPIKPPGIQATS
jgi:hypothetical protein